MPERPLCSNITLLHFAASFKSLFLAPKRILHFYIFKIKQCVTLAFSLHLNLFITNAVVRSIVQLTSGTPGEPGGIDGVLCCKHQVSELFPPRGWLVVLTVTRLTFIPSVAESRFPPSAPLCCRCHLATQVFRSGLQVFILWVCHLALSKAKLHRLSGKTMQKIGGIKRFVMCVPPLCVWICRSVFPNPFHYASLCWAAKNKSNKASGKLFMSATASIIWKTHFDTTNRFDALCFVLFKTLKDKRHRARTNCSNRQNYSAEMGQ